MSWSGSGVSSHFQVVRLIPGVPGVGNHLVLPTLHGIDAVTLFGLVILGQLPPVWGQPGLGSAGWEEFVCKSELLLQFQLHLYIIFHLLVGLLQMLHEDSNNYIDQNKLGH